jgi:hypothetical protein
MLFMLFMFYKNLVEPVEAPAALFLNLPKSSMEIGIIYITGHIIGWLVAVVVGGPLAGYFLMQPELPIPHWVPISSHIPAPLLE